MPCLLALAKCIPDTFFRISSAKLSQVWDNSLTNLMQSCRQVSHLDQTYAIEAIAFIA